MMRRYVLIVAGGKGLRMGGDLPKQFIPLHGKPVLMHTLETFHRWDASARLVLVIPEDHQPYWQMLCTEIGCKAPHQVVRGGETRFHSVSNGLGYIAEELSRDAFPAEQTWIGVHDGVRPFVSTEVIEACFVGAKQSGAVVPVIPMIDSIREKTEEESHPVDRSRYVAVQTPQVFRGDLLLKAYQQPYSTLFTDDASVVEAMGEQVTLVDGNRENIKLTTPLDLLVAKALLGENE